MSGILTIIEDVAGVVANPVTGLAKVALDVAPEIASWFGDDDAAKAVTKIAGAVKSLTGTDDPSKAKEALSDPTLVFQLRQQTAQLAHEERMAQLKAEQDQSATLLADLQSARVRDIELAKAGRGNLRANLMLGVAVGGLVAIIALLLIAHINGDSTIGGFVISVGSLLAAKIGTAFDFEFGSSAESVAKTNLLASLPAAVPQRK